MGYTRESGQQIKGADEIDIVYSGLEEIMTSATRENWEIAAKEGLSFRDACLGNAIGKVYQCYLECGITI